MVDGDVVASDPSVTSAQDYNGYWRLGGDVTWGDATSNFFAGSIDEFAVYGRQLPRRPSEPTSWPRGSTVSPRRRPAPRRCR